MKKNDLATDISIAHDTEYICPSDGYVYVYIPSANNSNFGRICVWSTSDNDWQTLAVVTPNSAFAFPGVSVFVRKGTKVKVLGTNEIGTFKALV